MNNEALILLTALRLAGRLLRLADADPDSIPENATEYLLDLMPDKKVTYQDQELSGE